MPIGLLTGFGAVALIAAVLAVGITVGRMNVTDPPTTVIKQPTDPRLAACWDAIDTANGIVNYSSDAATLSLAALKALEDGHLKAAQQASDDLGRLTTPLGVEVDRYTHAAKMCGAG